MRTVIKTIITTVLLSTLLTMAGTVEARLKYYRYNDNIPMVEMSLNMMVAMGVLEPIPGRLVHDGNPYNRMVNASYGPYSRSGYSYPDRSHRYSNYYGYNDYLDGPLDLYDSYYGGYNDRFYGSRYGYSPDYPRYRTWGDQWNSPWDYYSGNPRYSTWGSLWGNQLNSPRSSAWGSPWDYYSGSPWNSTWGSSPWGNQWNSPWSSTWGSPWDYYSGNPWNSTWGNQWNSPWGSTWGSPWDYYSGTPWMNHWSSQPGYSDSWPYSQGYSSLPSSPDAALGYDWLKNHSYQSDDSSLMNRNKESYNRNKENYRAEKTAWSGYPSSESYRRSGYRSSHNRTYPKLNGLWIGDNGAMLGIRGNRFLWYGDNNQYTKGQLARSSTMIKARIEGSAAAVRYHYRLRDNELVIISGDGKFHTFNRMPLAELPAVSARPRATYSSYHPKSDHSRVSYSNFRYDHKADRISMNTRNNSDRAGQDTDMNRRTYSMAPHEYYSSEKPAARSTHASYAGDRSMDNFPSVSRPADSDNDFHSREASINETGPEQQQSKPLASSDADTAAPATATPRYQHDLPAAGGAEPANAADSASRPAGEIRVESSTWTNYAGLDTNDPNTYLYSYLRDNDNKRTSDSASTDPDRSESTVSSATAIAGDRSNIWKPNDSYPDQRGYTGNYQSDNSAQNTGWARSVTTADSGMKKFAWPIDGSPWD